MESLEVLTNYLRTRCFDEAKSSEVLSAREFNVLGTTCSLLAKAASREAGVELSVALKKSVQSYQSSKQALPFIDGGCAVLRLNVYTEQLCVVLPNELAHELATGILRRERSSTLVKPDGEEITALGFLVTRILAKNTLLRNHRVYLTGIDSFDSEHSKKQFIPRIKQWLDREDCLLVEAEVRIDSATLPLILILSKRLRCRLASYATHSLSGESCEQILKNAQVDWKLKCELELNSMLSILSLSEGQVIPICGAGNEKIKAWLSAEQSPDGSRKTIDANLFPSKQGFLIQIKSINRAKKGDCNVRK